MSKHNVDNVLVEVDMRAMRMKAKQLVCILHQCTRHRIELEIIDIDMYYSYECPTVRVDVLYGQNNTNVIAWILSCYLETSFVGCLLFAALLTFPSNNDLQKVQDNHWTGHRE